MKTDYYNKIELPVIVMRKERLNSKLLKRSKAIVCFLLIGLMISNYVLLGNAYEGHIINVTAEICNYSETKTIGYWKNHPYAYGNFLPLFLGNEEISTLEQAQDIFDANASNMRDMLKAQLLAMKFNIAAFGIGEYMPEGMDRTLNNIVLEADDLLRQDPEPTREILDDMKTLLDDINNIHQLRYCSLPQPPLPEVTVIYPNGGEVWYLVPPEWAQLGLGIYPIQWLATNPNGFDSDLKIDIYFCKKSGNECFYQVANDTENDGEYIWQLPYDPIFITNQARVIIVAVDSANPAVQNWDISDRNFCPPMLNETQILKLLGLYIEPIGSSGSVQTEPLDPESEEETMPEVFEEQPEEQLEEEIMGEESVEQEIPLIEESQLELGENVSETSLEELELIEEQVFEQEIIEFEPEPEPEPELEPELVIEQIPVDEPEPVIIQEEGGVGQDSETNSEN